MRRLDTGSEPQFGDFTVVFNSYSTQPENWWPGGAGEVLNLGLGCCGEFFFSSYYQ